MSFVDAHAARAEVELEVMGVAVIREIELNRRYFWWKEASRLPMTNIALRRAVDGTLLVYVDDDVSPVDNVLPDGVFSGIVQDGWQRLRIPAAPEADVMLRRVAEVLGLESQPPHFTPEQEKIGALEPEVLSLQEPLENEIPAPFIASDDFQTQGNLEDVDDIPELEPQIEPLANQFEETNDTPDVKPQAGGEVVVPAHEPKQGNGNARSYASQFGKDLTELARQGKLGPVIGRDEELAAVVEILCKKGKNAPVLLGEPGVGKSAVVEALAIRVVNDQVPAALRGARIIEINLGLLIAGAGVKGELEDRVRRLLEEARAQPDLILFLDELHMINAPEMGGNVANMLKGDLARGTFKVIGATTHREYKQSIEADGALARRFQNVLVNEPSQAQTLEILRGLRPSIEQYHGVGIADEVLVQAVKLSARFVGDRQLPDKSIDLIDQACARTLLQGAQPGEIFPESAPELSEDEAIQAAIRAGDYARAKQLHAQRAAKNRENPK